MIRDQTVRRRLGVAARPGDAAGALWLLALLQGVFYVAIAAWSYRFAYDEPVQSRPIVEMLGLFAACFALHLWAWRVAVQIKRSEQVLRVVLISAFAFRAILLFSHPIQEVDIYRYLWDGRATSAGVNPFRYSPEQVLSASPNGDLPVDLQTLARIREASPSSAEILRRIHFGELTTVYPTTSQVVFALAALITPPSASVYWHVVAMKLVLILFDFGTIGVLLRLLEITRRHVGDSILYAWSPLVLKEFANSGHLDTIAVFLTVAAIFLVLRGCEAAQSRRSWAWLLLAGLFLGAAVGAKLYPIVLVPLLVVVVIRRMAFAKGVVFAALCLAAAGAWLAPMFLTAGGVDAPSGHRVERPGSGLATFLSRWEMNDLAFMVVLENVKPDPVEGSAAPPEAPWFVIVPNRLRVAVTESLPWTTEPNLASTPFALARTLTLMIFLGIAARATWRAARGGSDETLEGCFLTLAWFWALSPTMNPWYWTWALPLFPFARERAWLAVGLLLMLYYTRFWFTAHFGDTVLLGTGYRGENFFHFVIVPLEHGIWMGWLLLECCMPRKCDASHRSIHRICLR